MAANYNQLLSAGKASSVIANISTARTGVDNIASPADGTDLRKVFDANATNGGCVLEVGYRVIGTGTQAASLVYVWLTDSAGANAKIIDIFTVAAGSAMSNTVPGQTETKTYTFKNLEPGCDIWMSVSVVSASCSFNVWCMGGQFESY